MFFATVILYKTHIACLRFTFSVPRSIRMSLIQLHNYFRRQKAILNLYVIIIQALYHFSGWLVYKIYGYNTLQLAVFFTRDLCYHGSSANALEMCVEICLYLCGYTAFIPLVIMKLMEDSVMFSVISYHQRWLGACPMAWQSHHQTCHAALLPGDARAKKMPEDRFVSGTCSLCTVVWSSFSCADKKKKWHWDSLMQAAFLNHINNNVEKWDRRGETQQSIWVLKFLCKKKKRYNYSRNTMQSLLMLTLDTFWSFWWKININAT